MYVYTHYSHRVSALKDGLNRNVNGANPTVICLKLAVLKLNLCSESTPINLNITSKKGNILVLDLEYIYIYICIYTHTYTIVIHIIMSVRLYYILYIHTHTPFPTYRPLKHAKKSLSFANKKNGKAPGFAKRLAEGKSGQLGVKRSGLGALLTWMSREGS